MLYFIKQEGKEQNYLKIGYSKNIDSRINQYNTYNPDFKILGIASGDKEQETLLHDLIKNFKYKTEWFIEDEEVYNVWDNYLKNHPINNLESKYYSDYIYKYINSLDDLDFDIPLEESYDQIIINSHPFIQIIADITTQEEFPILILHRFNKFNKIIPIHKIEKGVDSNKFKNMRAYRINDILWILEEKLIGTPNTVSVLCFDMDAPCLETLKWEEIKI